VACQLFSTELMLLARLNDGALLSQSTCCALPAYTLSAAEYSGLTCSPAQRAVSQSVICL